MNSNTIQLHQSDSSQASWLTVRAKAVRVAVRVAHSSKDEMNRNGSICRMSSRMTTLRR